MKFSIDLIPKAEVHQQCKHAEKTMHCLMQNLDVPVGSYEKFKNIYVSEVMVAINTKGSTVGQSAGKVVQRKTGFSKLSKYLASNSKANHYSSVVMPSEHLSDINSSYMKVLEQEGYNALQMVALTNLRPSRTHYLLYRRFLR
jgi:hypothetical protein